MSMRLMPKSEVLAAKASQQRQDVDAGVKLAKRVDAVRDTLLQEEQKLEKFRVEKVKAIHAETLPLEEKLGALKKEVSDLEDRRKALLKPLDKEWADVREAQRQAELLVSQANSLFANAKEADRQAKVAVRMASDTLAKNLTKEERLKDALISANEADKKAQKCLRNAERVEAKAIKLAEAGEAEFVIRDNAYARKENGLILREANLKESEADLANGWKLLKDRQETLERSINRAKK